MSVPPSHGAEVSQARVFVTETAAIALAACGLAAGLLAAQAGAGRVDVSSHMAFSVAALVSILASRMGHARLAGLVLVWGCWLVLSTRVLMASEISLGLVAYPVLVVLAGWQGGAGALACGAASAAVLGLALWLQVPAALAPPLAWRVDLPYGLMLPPVIGWMMWRMRAAQAQHTVALLEEVQSLRRREAELHLICRALDKHPEGIVIVDRARRITYVNDAYAARSGWRRDEAVGYPSAARSNNGLSMAQRARMEAAIARGNRWSDEVANQRRDGTEIVESVTVVPIRDLSGQVMHYAEYKQDMTMLRRATDEMRSLGRFDPLTGLANRQWLIERLYAGPAVGVEGASRPRVLLLLDIDRFTGFNDLYGSDMGDRLLRAVATRLRRLAGEHGTLARISADEFAILLGDVDPDPARAQGEARLLAQAMLIDVQRPLGLDGSPAPVTVSASVGVTLFPGVQHDTPTAAMGRASTALRRARLAGDGRIVLFEASMAEAEVRRSRMEEDLRRGILAGELLLYLQPQVRAQGEIAGAEVLVRWQHPRDGLISPAAFLGVAEASDLILTLDRWVLAQSCALLVRLKAEGCRMRLSVNVSARQFQQADFADNVIDVLDRTGADPGLLTLELNENVLIADADDVMAKIHQLSALGIEFALDDFGTGFSSLSYLRRVPIHEIKIDRYFVQGAPVDAAGAALLESILRVAQSLGLRVVAEGVETPEQERFLRDRAPDIVCQGYLFHRPAPASAWFGEGGAGAPAA